jgi:hypothetical protein
MVARPDDNATNGGLHIPDLPADADTITVALAFAQAGWYVAPVRRGTKHPGSVLGKDWQHKSSREPAVIAAWFAGTDHDIALHVGRSGAVVFDVDTPANMPDTLARHLPAAPFQATRPDTEPARGHGIFATPAGRTFGNGTGRLGKGWGEVRGQNGVIVIGPRGDGRRWIRTGPVPVLPDDIAELLPAGGSAARDAASDAEIRAFIAEHTHAERPEVLNGLVSALRDDYAAGQSRHQSTLSKLAGAMKEARAGYYTARQAIDAIWPLWSAAATAPPTSAKQGSARTAEQANDEFIGLLAWAVGQANGADLGDVRARVDDKMPDNTAWARIETHDDDFWSQREILTHIRDYARAKRTSPWAMLAAELMHAVARVPPHIVLPAQVGSYGSLNLFVALVGASGAGKDAADAAARDAVTFRWSNPHDLPIVPLGTGEGIAATYRPAGTKPEENNPITAAIFTASEVDTWAALASRQGSILTAEIRKLWNGQAIGQANAHKDTRRVVAEHSYRACVLFGVQPERAAALLAAADGGMPQRLLWLPTDDLGAPDVPPATPDRRVVKLDNWKGCPSNPKLGGKAVLSVPACAVKAIDAHRLAVLRRDPSVDPIDGHALLCRLKVAAALMALEARCAVTEGDWTLAGALMAVSNATRAGCQQTVATVARRTNRARALAAAERDEIVSDRKLASCKQTILRWINTLPDGGQISRHDLRRKLKADRRMYFDAAIAELTDERFVAAVSADIGEAYTRGTRVPDGTRPPTSENDPCTSGTRVPPGSETDQGKQTETAPAGADTEKPPGDQPSAGQQTDNLAAPATSFAAGPSVNGYRRPGCICIGQPQPCDHCQQAASKESETQ